MYVSGSPSPHRNTIISRVRAAGMTVLYLNGVRGLERDISVASAKQFLNIHYDVEYQVFESIRCNRWIEAGMTVVTEPCINQEELRSPLIKVLNNMDFFKLMLSMPTKIGIGVGIGIIGVLVIIFYVTRSKMNKVPEKGKRH